MWVHVLFIGVSVPVWMICLTSHELQLFDCYSTLLRSLSTVVTTRSITDSSRERASEEGGRRSVSGLPSSDRVPCS